MSDRYVFKCLDCGYTFEMERENDDPATSTGRYRCCGSPAGKSMCLIL